MKQFTCKNQTTEKGQIFYAAAVRKGNSKIKLFRKKSNTNIQKSFDKSSSYENNKTPISQQIDLQQSKGNKKLREKSLI